jgi:Asp-tRNA(Asn)/Glu-tRNA(Gln) amidotransferase A subunit family amidase
MQKPLPVLSLIDALKKIKSRQFTSEEYTQSLLNRIALLDGNIQAWTRLKSEEVLPAFSRVCP